jgi:hypothetical protein
MDAQSDPHIGNHYMAMLGLDSIPVSAKKRINMNRTCSTEIAEVVELRDGARVAILKTFWIRILCRKWRRRRARRLWFMATQRQYTHRKWL